MEAQKRVWSKRPTVMPLPDQVYNDRNPLENITDLEWKVNLHPKEGFQKDSGRDLRTEEGWEAVCLPIQLETPANEYVFAHMLKIPENWKDSRIFLRFDGVNCEARVFLDGELLKEHYGGFVSWDCELPVKAAIPGSLHSLMIGVTDRPEDVSEFHRGGIIREIYLVRLPQIYLTRLHADTYFIGNGDDALLRVYCEWAGDEEEREEAEKGKEERENEKGKGEKKEEKSERGTSEEEKMDSACRVCFFLTDPDGIERELGRMESGNDIGFCDFPVASPKKWDCEHPYLYTLRAELISSVRENAAEKTETGTFGSSFAEEISHRRIGFRTIERKGSIVYLNGKELKLHGINHHDIYPTTGRAITPAIARRDVELFREANINFIRTSHYPPRQDFLDACDELGIYVEDETAVAFLGQGTPCRENDPAHTAHFMGPFSELIERDRSHPSVILWSLANESIWGSNFALENAYAHREDPSRLTIFSYPITQKEDDDRADIWSMHYAGWDQDPMALVDSFNRSEHEKTDWPVLHDESTHIPCYCKNDLRRDPGVRDFYGETIRRFYDKLFEKSGVLGCAIWAGIDDVWVHGKFNPAWGIVDGWRRKKPEFWHVRKAYSPIVCRGQLLIQKEGYAVRIENRFNHTNLKECRFEYTVNDGPIKTMQGPDIGAHKKGLLEFPETVQKGTKIFLKMYDPFENPVDEEELFSDVPEAEVPKFSGPMPEIRETEQGILISGKKDRPESDFTLLIDPETGLIKEGRRRGELILKEGPALHLTGLALAPWKRESFRIEQGPLNTVILETEGSCGRVKVTWRIETDGCGLMKVTGRVDEMPYASPRKLAMRIGDDTDSGGYEEVGIRFVVSKRLDELVWERKGQWTTYPDWHIGRNSGSAKRHCERDLTASRKNMNRTDAEETYALEETDSFLFGKFSPAGLGTADFRSMKAYVTFAKLQSSDGSGEGFCVFSDGSHSVRARILPKPENIVEDTDPRLIYRGCWTRVSTKNRSRGNSETWSKQKGDTCTLKFTGTGCEWVGSMDIIGGFAFVTLDGEKTEDRINLGNRQLTPGIARGYEKDYGRVFYRVDGLPYGRHELTVEVAGEHMPGAMEDYVFIDHFIILDQRKENDDTGKKDLPLDRSEGDTELIINAAFNYPELSWGCYTKEPVRVESGYETSVYVKL